MSSFAFDGSSARREDVSMRLRVQRMKNTAEQTKNLEEESRKMEERLQELKLAMGREKEEREKQGGGFWKAGQQGTLTKHAEVVLNRSGDQKSKEGKPRKIKLIKDEPITVPQVAAAKGPAAPGTMAFLLQKENAKPQGRQQQAAANGDQTVSNGGPRCGQCEQKSAVVSCFECSEQYCAHCFASFHLKGALKKHRSAPLIGRSDYSDSLPDARAPSTGAIAKAEATITNGRQQATPQQSAMGSSEKTTAAKVKVLALPASQDSTTGRGGTAAASLLQGTFDEEDSAQSFQEALRQWRTSGATNDNAPAPVASTNSSQQGIPNTTSTKDIVHAKKPGVTFSTKNMARTASPSCIDEGTSTVAPKMVAYEPEFQTSGGMTYAERLLLKRHRRTELGALDQAKGALHDSGTDDQCDSGTGSGNEQPLDFMQLREVLIPSRHGNQQYDEDKPSQLDIDVVEVDSLHDGVVTESMTAKYRVYEDDESLDDTYAEPLLTYRVPPENGSESNAVVKVTKPPSIKQNDAIARPPMDRRRNSGHKSGRTKAEALQIGVTALSQETSLFTVSKSGELIAPISVEAAGDELASNGSIVTMDPGRADAAGTSTPLLSARSTGSRRTQSRAGSSSRPRSRAKSMAERAAELERGGLSLEPTKGLKEVSSRSLDLSRLSVSVLRNDHVDELGNFFCLWLPPPAERTLTPTSCKQREEKPSTVEEIQRHHISNKLYQTSPHVWRPQSSTAASVTEAEAERCRSVLTLVTQGSERTSDLDEALQHHTPVRQLENTESELAKKKRMLASGLAVQSDSGHFPSVPAEVSERTTGYANAAPLVRQSKLPIKAQPASTPRTRKSLQGSTRGSVFLSKDRASQDLQPKSRPASEAACLSMNRAISDDDLSSYDLHGERTSQGSADSEELRTLDELERELASQTGRLTADGIVSCLPELDDKDEPPVGQSDLSEEADSLNASDGHAEGIAGGGSDIVGGWQLRESVLMNDFEEMERTFAYDSDDME